MRKAIAVVAVGVAVSASLLGSSAAFAKKAKNPPPCYPNCVGQTLSGNYDGASMPNADLSGALFSAAEFKEADLAGSSLVGATSAYITNSPGGAPIPTWFDGANMSRVNLTGAVLIARWNDVNFSDATAVGVDLNNSPMKSAILKNANFAGANLTKVNLEKSNLSYATLTDVNFTRARLKKAKLINADLTNTNFAHANLKRANLTGADITGANFTKAKFKKTICPDGTKTNKGCS